MHITPDLIPPGEFHTGSWLLPLERPTWYYFAKDERPRAGNPIVNPGFIESVDTPLRELVRFLHDQGIETTPSCSGHHCSERDLGAIHRGLLRDAQDITNGGLQLIDIESGRRRLYHESGYQLPWNEDTFIERMLDYQQQGVLGTRLQRRPNILMLLRRCHIPRVRIEERDGVLLFLTKEKDEAHIRGTWDLITATVKEAFKRESHHTYASGFPSRAEHASRKANR